MNEKKMNKNNRAIIFFTIQRNEATQFRAAEEIDPVYARLLKKAVENGVEALAYKLIYDDINNEITVSDKIPVITHY